MPRVGVRGSPPVVGLLAPVRLMSLPVGTRRPAHVARKADVLRDDPPGRETPYCPAPPSARLLGGAARHVRVHLRGRFRGPSVMAPLLSPLRAPGVGDPRPRRRRDARVPWPALDDAATHPRGTAPHRARRVGTRV